MDIVILTTVVTLAVIVRREGLARWTGLEPATPGVTGRYSNRLSYHRAWRIG
jgi:hypothetical protein